MTKKINIACFAYDVYDTNISSKTARLDAAVEAITDCYDELYRDSEYLIFVGPEYMFSRKNYTVSSFNTPEFLQIDPDFDKDGESEMEEELGVRVKVGYTEKEKNAIVTRLRNLSSNKPRMMIMPGTILWREYVYFKKLRGAKSKMFNTLPVISNGAVVHSYDKKRDSDEIKADYRLRRDRLAEKKYHGYQEARYIFQAGTASNSFTHWGMRFGVEICADHAGCVLKNALAGGRKPDIQVLVSAGMPPSKNGIALGDGGVFVHCDGSTTPASQSVSVAALDKQVLKQTAAREGEQISDSLRVWRVEV